MGGGSDGGKSKRQGVGAPAVEFGGRREARDGMMGGGRGEILAEGQERDARRAEIAQGGGNLSVRFA